MKKNSNPLRKNSKEYQEKQKKNAWSTAVFMVLTEAAASNLDAVYVFTDDTDILTYIENEYAWNQK
jgi:N-acylneuraminate cytidylyltransferase